MPAFVHTSCTLFAKRPTRIKCSNFLSPFQAPRRSVISPPRNFAARLSMCSTPNRELVFKYAIEAAVEDFVKSGMNICIGDGPREVLLPLLDNISAMMHVEGLIDMAFVAPSTDTMDLIQERDLPSDLTINFKRGIDLFIAPVTYVDENCNALFDTCNLAENRYAAEIATNIVLIAHEEDLAANRTGLKTIPVKIVPFLSDVATEALRSPQMRGIGIRDAVLRPDHTNIADISLSPHTVPKLLDDELKRLPAVTAVGVLPSLAKTTVVIASNDLQPVDMTSSLHSMANLSKEARTTALTGQKREKSLQAVAGDWKIIAGQQEALLAVFRFKNEENIQAFVRYIHYISRNCWHHPEIKQTYGRVQICLTTAEAHGISELDIMCARCYSRVFNDMHVVKMAPQVFS